MNPKANLGNVFLFLHPIHLESGMSGSLLVPSK